MLRRAGAASFLILLCLFDGCGYVGPVLPPSPNIPNPVTDLQAIEKGNQLDVTFSVPPRTTDSIVIKRYSAIDLAVGPAEMPFDFEKWSASAEHFDVPVPPPNDPDDPRPQPISKTLPVQELIGKHVVVAVRTSARREDHFSQWSNRAVLDIVAPLKPPEVKAEATKNGYLLSWRDEGPGIRYLIFRRSPGDKAPEQIGTSDSPVYVDATSQWDTPYTYRVSAQKGTAQSELSQELTVNHPDTFAPEVPASVTALAGPASIEVSWSRSPDLDLKGYYVYRSTNGGEFVQQADLTILPTFSDRTIEHGKTYRYEISAIDQKGNRSARSQPTEPISF